MSEIAKTLGRPKKYTDVEVMKTKIEEYFADADKREVVYTVEGLAYWLDMDRDSILNYEKDEAFFGTIKKAKARILASLQEMAATGGYNPTMAIFNLKNNYGYKDKSEIDIDAKVQDKRGLDDFYNKGKSE